MLASNHPDVLVSFVSRPCPNSMRQTSTTERGNAPSSLDVPGRVGKRTRAGHEKSADAAHLVLKRRVHNSSQTLGCNGSGRWRPTSTSPPCPILDASAYSKNGGGESDAPVATQRSNDGARSLGMWDSNASA